ncbi:MULTISPECIES: penicillin-binding protein [Thermomonospora]|uniref:Membrane peptidoglycan carboxypeptidase n=1 Tax=Thermomonospora cellulosilytica TaxID=1411118 RepID=A0A7W3R8Q9_9ACTN|nr:MULTISPECIES: penicillin-binding protein [Thermomonospora]MBA9003570.1 membrane peptidoglycan carboxypeptidase [Thermomonospora cellulosilytica]
MPPRSFDSDRRATAAQAVRGLVGMGALAGVLVALLALPLVGTAGVSARDGADWFQREPAGLSLTPSPQRSRILAADGSTIATFYYQNRVEVRLDQVAPIARKAVLAIEDSRFYEHGALDTRGTLRALVSNLNSGEVTQGGSGITQQYVKNLLLEQADTEAEQRRALEVTPARKINELRYAVALEKRLSKDEILRRYLNIAYFGDGAYGIEAAARRYFSKSAEDLDLAEAATLAGVVRNPNAYNPRLHPGTARKRRDLVLNRMVELGWIEQEQARRAAADPIELDITETPNGCTESRAPFFCDYVQREILTNPVFGRTAKERERLLKQGGLTIRTTLDPQTQRAAQRAVDRHVPPKNSAGKAAAEVLIEPGTGKIKGMVVDRKLGPNSERGKTWINFAADASHGSSIGMQAGSTFKAFTLAAALEEGMPFGTRLMAPHRFTPTGYENCDGESVGDPSVGLRNSAESEGGRSFSLVTGTHHSVNTFFLALQREVGLCDTVEMAERLGMKRADGKPLEQVPSFTLGANTVSPLRLAAAYAAFAARGEYCKPIAITSITHSSGRKLKVPSADCKQVMDEGVADAVNYVLQGVLTRGTARGLGIGRPAAGKTGTVDDYSAAWFAGYTPELAAAVWVGDPRGGYKYPMSSLCMDGRCYGPVFGATIPAPIWHDSMIGALSGRAASAFHRPPSRYFSRGSGEDRIRVPDVRGMRLSAAIARLRAAGFTVDVGDEVDSTVPEGRVAEIEPGPGTAHEPGTTVTIRPSSGRPEEDVPEDAFPDEPRDPFPFPDGPEDPPIPD